MSSVFVQYWDVFLFYGVVAILLYTFRSKFEFQGIAALFKTTFGLTFMTRTGERWPRFWHALGMLSIILGFLGMAFITVYLFYGLYSLFFVPGAPPTLSPVIPGVKIPGVPITFPLWYTLIGLFFAVIVHEACHGIWSAAYKIPIKSSGFAFFGPIPGAFVEPDEKVMEKRPKREQLAIFSAGPFANMVLAVVALGIISLLGIALSGLVTQEGVSYGSVANESGAQAAGLPPGLTVTALDGQAVRNTDEISDVLTQRRPGETVVLTANGTDYPIMLIESPDVEGKAYLGILGVRTATSLKNPSMTWLYDIVIILSDLFVWTFIISLGIGIANLLPIGPVDGGRMFLLALQTRYSEKRAKGIWTRWSFLLLFVVVILVFVPILKAIF